jgi:hypothetical protein
MQHIYESRGIGGMPISLLLCRDLARFISRFPKTELSLVLQKRLGVLYVFKNHGFLFKEFE